MADNFRTMNAEGWGLLRGNFAVHYMPSILEVPLKYHRVLMVHRHFLVDSYIDIYFIIKFNNLL